MPIPTGKLLNPNARSSTGIHRTPCFQQYTKLVITVVNGTRANGCSGMYSYGRQHGGFRLQNLRIKKNIQGM